MSQLLALNIIGCIWGWSPIGCRVTPKKGMGDFTPVNVKTTEELETHCNVLEIVK